MDMTKNASLDPQDFRHHMKDVGSGIQISQVDHPLQVRAVTELHIPCACGRPLCGIETEWISDPRGSALYYIGVCLVCGRQKGIYMSEPQGTVGETKLSWDARLAKEVQAIVEQVTRLREDSGDTDMTDAVETRTEAA